MEKIEAEKIKVKFDDNKEHCIIEDIKESQEIDSHYEGEILTDNFIDEVCDEISSDNTLSGTEQSNNETASNEGEICLSDTETGSNGETRETKIKDKQIYKVWFLLEINL